MQTGLLNKGETTATLCPYCGEPEAHNRCRAVNDGYFCWRDGLQDATNAVLRKSADPLAGAIEQDRDVKRARAELAQLQQQAAELGLAWENAIKAEYAAKNQRLSVKRDIVTDGGGSLREWVPPGTPTQADIVRLSEMASQAQIQRDHILEQVQKGRDHLKVARSRARARLVSKSTG
jgi:hypothetical protein